MSKLDLFRLLFGFSELFSYIGWEWGVVDNV